MIKLLTPDELSKLLRIPKRSIYRFAQDGHIPGGFRVGKHWRFRQDVIENWINGQSTLKHVPELKVRRQ
ncbi:MAG: helix-turn-helix domain-containing protein [Candidatus Omnitrophica bacterium]|nr:helix-turn-helix domain-containing protein [Candidatus Omnitrophota bacterium]